MAFTLKIDVQQLGEGDQTLAIDHPPSLFDLDGDDWTFTGRVEGEVTFHLIDPEVKASGRLNAKAVGKCARCLAEIPVDVEARIRYLYHPSSREPTGDVSHDHVISDAPEDAYYSGGIIDSLTEIREALLLELPSFPHCEACEAKRGEPIHIGEAIEAEDAPGEPEWKKKLRSMQSES